MATASFSTNDRNEKRTSMSIPVDDAVLSADIQAVADALDATILGTAVRAAVTTLTIVDGGTGGKAPDKDADRGQKWELQFQRADGKIYTHYIGTADSAQLPATDSKGLDLTAGVGLTLKTAVDAVYRDETGAACVLISANKVHTSLN